MNLFCCCTDTNPDFVNALLCAYTKPYFGPPGEERYASLWLCYDCFEQHTEHDRAIDVCFDEASYATGWFIAEEDSE